MENKYYIPNIEEFHVGFEYETFIQANEHRDGNGWMSVKFPDPFTGSDLSQIKKRIFKDNIRTKYLDKDDIEELGFESEYIKSYYGDELIEGYTKGDEDIWFNLEFIDAKVIISKCEVYDQVTGNFTQTILFLGYIKNKSELKQVLKMLGIYES